MGPLSRVYDRLVNCSGRALVLLRVALLSISLLACGALQRVAFKRIAYPLGPYPVLLLCVISAAFIPLFGVPYLYVKIVAGGTDDTRILPYAVIGALNAVNGILTIFGNAFVPGYLQTILQQTVIPFTMILSVFLCGTRYSAQHVIGVVIIILGVALQLEPLFTDSNSDEVSSSSSTSLSWSLVYLIAPLPVALAAVYQELEFSRRKVNLISLMYWSNLIQALLLFMLVPIQLLASSDSEITRWPAAFRCILKSDETVSPECSDGQAGM
ncbi:Cg10p [Perkinsus chesapeaki]|uniref:Cg10p n=1 Tax=Perkinsus chesapeaki TaxID=330153 RepID=A0A7J6N0C9_PERCH|nr:Cg10p [Perkinsus chesapeaki]